MNGNQEVQSLRDYHGERFGAGFLTPLYKSNFRIQALGTAAPEWCPCRGCLVLVDRDSYRGGMADHVGLGITGLLGEQPRGNR